MALFPTGAAPVTPYATTERTDRRVKPSPLQEPFDETLADLDLEARLDLRPKVNAALAHYAMARRIGAGLDQARSQRPSTPYAL